MRGLLLSPQLIIELQPLLGEAGEMLFSLPEGLHALRVLPRVEAVAERPASAHGGGDFGGTYPPPRGAEGGDILRRVFHLRLAQQLKYGATCLSISGTLRE